MNALVRNQVLAGKANVIGSGAGLAGGIADANGTPLTEGEFKGRLLDVHQLSPDKKIAHRVVGYLYF